MNWESHVTLRSGEMPGVEFVLARMTFGRRIELMRRVRELAVRLEYFEAGRDEKNQMEASLLAAEIDRLYLEWGLLDVHGLAIDGEPADARVFIENGPEALVHEALRLVRSSCGLDEQERKN